MIYKGFCGPSYPSAAYTADQERTVNFYFEKMETPGASSPYALYPFPGLVSLTLGRLASLGAGGGGRAHFAQDNREFGVVGNSVVEFFVTGDPIIRGTVVADAFPATISSNGDGGNQLFITSGNRGYIYDLTANTVTEVAALVNRARMGDQIDGYFLSLDTDSSTLLFSNLLDGTVWDTGVDFAQRTGSGDPWVAMKVLGTFIYLLGRQTSEVWFNTGEAFPFARHPSGQINVGCAATWSLTIVADALMWLSSTNKSQGAVMRMEGFEPQRVSTFAMESAIGKYTESSSVAPLTASKFWDAEGDSYSVNGHNFYCLSFPSQDVANWAWDSTNGLWTEQGTWDPAENSDFVTWRARWAVQIFGQTRILSTDRPDIYRLSLDSTIDRLPAGTSTGTGFTRYRFLRRAPAIMNELERVYISEFKLDFEPATVIEIQGADPVDDEPIMMRQSKDGGKSWGSERWITTGPIGAYGTMARWHRCGQGRRMVFEVSFSAAIPFRITNAYLEPGNGFRMTRAG